MDGRWAERTLSLSKRERLIVECLAVGLLAVELLIVELLYYWAVEELALGWIVGRVQGPCQLPSLGAWVQAVG